MTQQNSSSAHSMIARLHELIPILLERSGVVGISLALIEDGQTVWNQGFGLADRTTGRPVVAETIFEAASLSKPVFAYAVLKLCEEGLLGLDTPLSTYLPEPYIAGDPRVHVITARHVLSHTTGFPNWRRQDESLRIHFAPGSRFSYSGEGYVYLQKVIEQLAGQAAAGWMWRCLLEPLGMDNSSYTWLDRYDQQIALGYQRDGAAAVRRKEVEMNAAYSLLTTPTDFASFMCTLMLPESAGDVALNAASVAGMFTPQICVNDDGASWHAGWPQPHITENKQLSWGLGWGIQRTGNGDVFWHWGDNGPFKAFAVASHTDRSGLVLMANSEHGDTLWRSILDGLFSGPHPALDWIASL